MTVVLNHGAAYQALPGKANVHISANFNFPVSMKSSDYSQFWSLKYVFN